MDRRRGGLHTGETIFSGKIFCGDCGKFYGPKVWHSNDKYRKVIWQCTHRNGYRYDDTLPPFFLSGTHIEISYFFADFDMDLYAAS